MLYFYNPTTTERVNQSYLYNMYGVTPETAQEKGWFPFSLIQPAYDNTFYYLSDDGVEEDGQGGYKITWSYKEKPVDPVKTELKKRLAAKRYDVEVAGIVFNGATILTDRESQATVTGAKAFSDLNPTAEVDWKSHTGWTKINAAAIAAVASAVGTHVQQCFSNERSISEAIDAATTIDELKAVDMTAGWPATVPAPVVDPFRLFP